MDSQFLRVGKVYPAKNEERNDYCVRFRKITWGLIKNDYWEEYGQVGENNRQVPRFTLVCNYKKIGIVMARKTKKNDKPYLHLLKMRDRMKKGLAGRERQYFIFDVDENFNPTLESEVSYKIVDSQAW